MFRTRHATFPLNACFGQGELTGAAGECTATLESDTAAPSKYVVELKATSLQYEAHVLTNKEIDIGLLQRTH